LGTTNDEVEAETNLGAAGISPSNGWIADYPITPAIIGELQSSIEAAADEKKIQLSKDEALQKFNDIITGLGGPSVEPYNGNGAGYQTEPNNAEAYPNPTVVNNYYYDEGPPVVTYYAPPPDYYYLYSWIPFPFWCTGFWFAGYFILNDFYRPIHIHHHIGFITNHFNDFREHRVFRIDPRSRFHGRTFAGIGAPRGRSFISTGIPRSNREIFNAPRLRASPGMRPMPGMRSYSPPPRSSFAPRSRSFAPQSHGSRTFAPPAQRGGGAFQPRGSAFQPRGGVPEGGLRK
jgi:hypothetical protein